MAMNQNAFIKINDLGVILQKGAHAVQKCSVDQKGTIAVQSLWQ